MRVKPSPPSSIMDYEISERKPSAPTPTRATSPRRRSYCTAASNTSAKSNSPSRHVTAHTFVPHLGPVGCRNSALTARYRRYSFVLPRQAPCLANSRNISTPKARHRPNRRAGTPRKPPTVSSPIARGVTFRSGAYKAKPHNGPSGKSWRTKPAVTAQCEPLSSLGMFMNTRSVELPHNVLNFRGE
jgi:hypothetical protein